MNLFPNTYIMQLVKVIIMCIIIGTMWLGINIIPGWCCLIQLFVLFNVSLFIIIELLVE
jgi:hypothetical protein